MSCVQYKSDTEGSLIRISHWHAMYCNLPHGWDVDSCLKNWGELSLLNTTTAGGLTSITGLVLDPDETGRVCEELSSIGFSMKTGEVRGLLALFVTVKIIESRGAAGCLQKIQ